MLSGVTILCFTASYAVTLLLEVSRLFFRAPVRIVVMILMSAAGLLAHTVYLVALARDEYSGQVALPLSSWYDWCIMAAWVVAAAYLGLALRRPQNTVGLFLLPLVLALIGIANLVEDVPPFERVQATNAWTIVHGVALLLGTVSVTLGFAAGLMYLVQAYRLKHKLAPRAGFRLPSMEWLQRFNRRALWISTAFLALGLVSGVVLNLINHSNQQGNVPWTDPVVWSSAVLLIWLLAASLFEGLYKPARQGRKVAYLTMASFVFLAMALGLVLFSQHASQTSRSENRPKVGPTLAQRTTWTLLHPLPGLAARPLPEGEVTDRRSGDSL